MGSVTLWFEKAFGSQLHHCKRAIYYRHRDMGSDLPLAEISIRRAGRGWEGRRERSVKAQSTELSNQRGEPPISYLMSVSTQHAWGPSMVCPRQQSSKSRLLPEWFQWSVP